MREDWRKNKVREILQEYGIPAEDAEMLATQINGVYISNSFNNSEFHGPVVISVKSEEEEKEKKAKTFKEDAIRQIRALKGEKKTAYFVAAIAGAVFFIVSSFPNYFEIPNNWHIWIALTGLSGLLIAMGALSRADKISKEIEATAQYYKNKIYELVPWKKEWLREIDREVLN